MSALRRPGHCRDVELGALGSNFSEGIFGQFTHGRGCFQRPVFVLVLAVADVGCDQQGGTIERVDFERPDESTKWWTGLG